MQPLRCLRGSLRPTQSSTAVFLQPPPLFSCPASIRAFGSGTRYWPDRRCSACDRKNQTLGRRVCSARPLHTEHQPASHGDPSLSRQSEPAPSIEPPEQALCEDLAGSHQALPHQCTGCGALSQSSDPHVPGYFDLKRNDVKRFLGSADPRGHGAPTNAGASGSPDDIVREALQGLSSEQLAESGGDLGHLLASLDERAAAPKDEGLRVPPLCARCHNLVHHSVGESIYHPSVDAIRETILESPYKYNHVYHVIDAADFPMSLMPRLNELLDLMPLRTRNRRSMTGKFHKDQKIELSFIITRSDLLAPRKEQVDRLMPQLQEELRDVLGRTAKHVRLGNVKCVSAKRSWWTKELKEDIWKRGGAGWMVGRANVGKSQLFDSVFPKGRMQGMPSKHKIVVPVVGRKQGDDGQGTIDHGQHQSGDESQNAKRFDDSESDKFSLLPPARPETNYPEMPVVSSLPGTTASPIRVPFGGGKGELIDLPGLERTRLDMHVRPEHRASLLMKSRVAVEQQVMRPWNSLLLGGFIRLTPRTPDMDFLAYAFTPIKAHLTGTEKAVAIQEQRSEAPNVENISEPGTGEKIRLAGSFPLRWDVTKARTGPITRKDAVGIKVDRLPYRVLSTDILIEGCGWVEVVAQVRTKDLFGGGPRSMEPAGGVVQTLDLEDQRRGESGEPNWPIIDVFSPEGRFIGARRPIDGWLMNKPLGPKRGRPKKSMKGAKKLAKSVKRAERSSDAVAVAAQT